ncbi:hypothetical protein IFO70_05460 [Phormidium tenue FACHB-886]|nr:hypothetical protein [Phormidium tenue FACHB-886]
MTSSSNPQNSEKRFPTPNSEVHFQTPDPTVNQNLDPARLEETLHQHKENTETAAEGDAAELDTAIDDPAGADFENPVDQQISSLGRTLG